MSYSDALSLSDHAVMLGLVTREQAQEAVAEAEDGSVDALVRSFNRKGFLTSWQVERLKKGDPSGFFHGGCKVLFHLAEGTFARVYRGVQLDSGNPVAIKVLRQRFASDPAAVNLFHKEAEAGMKLRHPNIVQILDYGETDGQHFMIMEYVEGANLRDFLKIRPKISQEEALPLMLGLARGLQHSFQNGVTHRDVKGTNILISNAGEAKLVDFGLATLDIEDKKAAMQNQRTVDYSALERTCGSEKGDPRSDLYFLGCVFYQMITGQVPMKEAESKDMLHKMLKRSFSSIVPIGEHRHAPDPELARIIDKMMKVELRARYQTIDEVIADLEAFQTHHRSGISGLEPPADGEPDFFAHLEDVFLNRPGGEAAPAPAEESQAARTADRKNLLCVEAQEEVRDAFRKSLTKLGYRVILVGSAELAAERYREALPDVVVFDADGLGPEALAALVDMHDKAHEDGHDLAALVLLGPKQRGLRNHLPEGDRFTVLQKPLKMKEVQLALTTLVPPG